MTPRRYFPSPTDSSAAGSCRIGPFDVRSSRHVCGGSAQSAVGRTLRDGWQLSGWLRSRVTSALTAAAHLADEIALGSSLVGAGQPAAGSLEARATLSDKVPEIVMPPTLAGIRDLLIHMATTTQEREVGSTLTARDHPCGMTVTFGYQTRQRVGAGHDRGGRALGWRKADFSTGSQDRVGRCRTRGASSSLHLPEPVPVRTGVSCPHLAGHACVRFPRRLPHDFATRYEC